MKYINKTINAISTIIIVVGIAFVGLYLFGITPYVVLSGSMEPVIQTGSLCFINKHTKYEAIKEADIIAFRTKDGTLISHRVVQIDDTGITTKGDNNSTKDGVTKKENYVGKNIFWIPKAGYLIVLIQTPKGKIIFGTCVLVLFLSGLLLGENSKEKKNE